MTSLEKGKGARASTENDARSAVFFFHLLPLFFLFLIRFLFPLFFLVNRSCNSCRDNGVRAFREPLSGSNRIPRDFPSYANTFTSLRRFALMQS